VELFGLILAPVLILMLLISVIVFAALASKSVVGLVILGFIALLLLNFVYGLFVPDRR
jgi:hypothetical protein